MHQRTPSLPISTYSPTTHPLSTGQILRQFCNSVPKKSWHYVVNTYRTQVVLIQRTIRNFIACQPARKKAIERVWYRVYRQNKQEMMNAAVRVLVGGGGGHVCLGGPPCSAVGFLLPVSLSSLVSLPLSPCLRSLCSHPLKPYQPHRLAHVAHIVLTRIFLSPIYAHRPPSSLSSFSLVPHHGLPNGYPCRHNACDECAAISL